MLIFGDPAGPAQLAGAAAILGGIALSSVPRPASWRLPDVAQPPLAAGGPERAGYGGQ